VGLGEGTDGDRLAFTVGDSGFLDLGLGIVAAVLVLSIMFVSLWGQSGPGISVREFQTVQVPITHQTPLEHLQKIHPSQTTNQVTAGSA